MEYDGCSKLTKTQSVPATNMTHRTVIQNVMIPEGMLLFAVPKDYLSGTFKYQNCTDHNIFSDHNIKQLNLFFGDRQFFVNSPHIGDFSNDIMETKTYIEYLTDPPFGLKMDPKRVRRDQIVNGAIESPFPHIWIKFSNYKDKSRILPFQNEGLKRAEKNNLAIDFTFGFNGAPANVVYIMCLYNTGNVLTLNTKTLNWSNPYIDIALNK
jgi:hypothetical protein